LERNKTGGKTMTLRGQKVFVTGASGFIGGRLVEKLVLDEGAEVVALVRKFMNASRLARFPIKMVAGDVLYPDSLNRAMDGCAYAVHCAVDGGGTNAENRRVTVEGTRNICQAAEKFKIKRLVHLSTVSVYGQTAPGVLDETSPKKPQPDPYGTTKLEAETVALEFAGRRLPVTVLQPTVVYGPWSHWTVSTAKLLGRGTVVLPDDGGGRCNAVFVDDVVSAIFCALQASQSVPGPYLISGPAPVSWADYYRAYAEWIPGSATGGEPFKAMEKKFARQEFAGAIAPALFPPGMRLKISRFMQNFPGFWQAYNKSRGRTGASTARNILTGALPMIKPDPGLRITPLRPNVQFMALRSDVSIKKAQAELGYQPQFDLPKAMQIVGPWLQWAGLAPR
jgi:nucleoside-diphosphate-sugar epimerase